MKKLMNNKIALVLIFVAIAIATLRYFVYNHFKEKPLTPEEIEEQKRQAIEATKGRG